MRLLPGLLTFAARQPPLSDRATGRNREIATRSLGPTLAAHPPSDLKALTSMRFFAALMIFLFHLREFNSAPWLYAIAGSMRHGVSFFFVLSGFILTPAYRNQTPLSYRRFLRARFARLYPTVLASTLLLLARCR